MSEDAPSGIVIKGITLAGKKFRPSDWAERLAGVFTCFGPDQRLCYSPYIHPITLEGISCVEVDPTLRNVDPMAYNFLLNFAKDNELQVVDPSDEQH